jgi:hypothetical protein
LPSHFPDDRFDLIIWNHPHLGTEDFRLHRFLLAHFFNSASLVMRASPQSRLCVSLVQGQETRWQLVEQAARSGLHLSGSPSLFVESQFPGYICKRNKNGQTFKNQHTLKHTGSAMKSFVYRFAFSEGGCETVSAVDTDHAGIVKALEAISLQPNGATKSDGSNNSKNAFTVVIYDPNSRRSERQAKHWRRKKSCADPATEHVTIYYRCPEPDCGRQFETKRGAQQHYHCAHVLRLYSNNNDNNDRFSCDSCPDRRNFGDEEALRQHCISRHSTLSQEEQVQLFGQQRRKITNSTVGIAAEETNLDDGHALINDNNSDSYYPCEICGQAVRNSRNGQLMHLESLKPVIGMRMKCPICQQKKLMDYRALEQHYLACREIK